MGRRIWKAAAVAVYSGEKAQFLHMVWIGALIFMVLFLAVAVAEFFLLNIPEVFALESGMAARKRMRQPDRRADPACENPEEFVIEKDIMVVHTDERVEGRHRPVLQARKGFEKGAAKLHAGGKKL